VGELKPCPFCGGASRASEVTDQLVGCGDGECAFSIWEYHPDAWNRRPVEDALRARVAELERRNAALCDTLLNQHANHCNEAWTGRGMHSPECDSEDLTPSELAAAEARRKHDA